VVGAGIRAMFEEESKIKKRPFHAMPKNALKSKIEHWQRQFSQAPGGVALKRGRKE
jgi:hypothetical protein